PPPPPVVTPSPVPVVTPPPPPPTDSGTPNWVAGSGNWNVAANWDDKVVPTLTDAVTINPASPVIVTVDDQEAAAALTLGHGNTVQAVVNANAGAGGLTVTGTANIAGLIDVDSTITDPSITFSGPVTVQASGEIEAVGSGAVLFAGNTVANLNIILASGGGHVIFSGSTVANAGTIETSGAGSVVQLADAYIAGGTLQTGSLASNSGGQIEILAVTGSGASNISVLDGSTDGTLTLNAYVQVDDGANLELLGTTAPDTTGTFDNTGTIVVGAVTGAELVIDGTVTLDGSGTIALDGSGSAIVGPLQVADILINSGNTISGSGTIQNLGIENLSGTIEADGNAAALTFVTDNLGNAATVIAENGGGMTFFGTGVLNAAGATMTATSGGGMVFDIASLNNQSHVTADGGNITLEFTALENSGTLLAQNNGSLTLADSNDLTFSNAGTIEAGNNGTVNIVDAALNNSGTIEAGGGTVTLSGATIEGGNIADNSNVTVTQSSAINGDAEVSGSGTLTIDPGATLTLAGGSISGGNIELAPGGAPAVTEIAAPSVEDLPPLDAIAPALSANGEYLVYDASTTLPGSGDNGNDGVIELYNVATGQQTDISAAVKSELPGDFHSGELFGGIPSISADGQYAVFEGDYPVQGQNYTSSDVFLYNTATQAVTLVSANSIDNGNAFQPVISADGQVIAMGNDAPNSNGDSILITNQAGAVLDTITGDPNYVPPQNGGDFFGNQGSVEDAALSGNGRYVSFWTTATQITVNGALIQTGNNTGYAQVYVYDTLTHTLQMVSANQGQPGNGDSGALSLAADNSNWTSPLSANGNFVVFQSTATNLLPGGTPAGDSNIYLYNLRTGTIELISAVGNTPAQGSSVQPSISADGSTITFASNASNLPGANGGVQTYIVTINPTTGAIENGPELLSTGFAGANNNNGQNVFANTVSDEGNVAAVGGAALAFDDGQFSLILKTGSVSSSAGTVDFSGLGLTDYNPAGQTLTLTASVAHGTLAANGTVTGWTVIENGSNGSNYTLEITGSYAAIEAALNSGVTYTPTGSPASDTLTLTVTDGLGDTATNTTVFDPSTGSITGGSDTGQYDIFLDSLAGTLDVTANAAISGGATLDGGTVYVASGVTLTLDATLDNTVINNAGTLAFTGPSTLDNAMVFGGDVTIASGVTLTLDNVVLDGVAITVNSDGTTPSIEVDAGDTLTYSGTTDTVNATGAVVIDNNGHIIYAAGSTIDIGWSMITFEGTGTITRNNNTHSTVASVTSVNEGNTIDGYGTIGNGMGSSTIFNDAGAYDADVNGQQFIFDTGNVITNAATFEATGGGILVIESTVTADTTVLNDTGGTGNVSASADSEVELSNATIGTSAAGSGGTIAIAAGGLLEGSGTSEIENATINISGTGSNAGELITGGTFTLDNDTVNGGILTGEAQNASFNVDQNDTLTLDDATINGPSITDGGTVQIDTGSTLKLTGGTDIVGNTAVDFFDDFDRPNGSPGNGWSVPSGAAGLIIQNDVLTPSTTTGIDGLFRPVDLFGAVSVSATVTQESGYY
ncbi:MAG TPA: hypothetical protein VEF90_02675, partial [Xanthobacteraceae bacterium]|nr:hypothetical protein [Xanthobacteraceae bacterium]